MKIKINGKETQVPDGITLIQLLGHLRIDKHRVAIELNKEIAKKTHWDRITLKEGDNIEIVTFVGGG